MVTKEQRKEIEDACKVLTVNSNYQELYIDLNHILRYYSTMMAEHDPKFGDVPTEETSQDINLLNILITNIERLIIDDLNSK